MGATFRWNLIRRTAVEVGAARQAGVSGSEVAAAAMAAVEVASQEGVQQGVYFRQVASHTAGTLPKYMSVALLPAIVKVE